MWMGLFVIQNKHVHKSSDGNTRQQKKKKNGSIGGKKLFQGGREGMVIKQLSNHGSIA